MTILFYYVDKNDYIKTHSKEKKSISYKAEYRHGIYNYSARCNSQKISGKIAQEAYEGLPDDIAQIYFTHESSTKLAQKLPKNITQVFYAFGQQGSDFVRALPESVTTLELCPTYAYTATIDEYIAIVQALPLGVTKLTLPNLFHYSDNDLTKLFRNIPKQVQELTVADDDFEQEDIPENRLNPLLMALPASIKRMYVPKYASYIWELDVTKKIDLSTYFVPESYKKLIGNETDLYTAAQIILQDYTKEQSCSAHLSLFFSLHWNRHHCKAVSAALKETHNFEDLMQKLSKIEVNPTGSLAKRIRFLQQLACKDEEKQEQEIMQKLDLDNLSI